MVSTKTLLLKHYYRRQGSRKIPTVPKGHKHRVTTPENPRKILRTPAEPRRDPTEPSESLRGTLSETPAEPSERPISSESLAEGCAPRMVTLRNFNENSPPNVSKILKNHRRASAGAHWEPLLP